MFSYLRPRSRHGPTNPPITPESSRASIPTPDYQSRFPPAQHPPPPPPHPPPPPPPTQSAWEEEPYVSPVSARAPILPPIPRVASIYGTPAEYSAPEHNQNGSLPETYHSRVQSIEEDKVSESFDSSPKSTAPASGGRMRSNFSRPFHGRDGSLTPSEERANLQEIWRSAAQTAQLNELQQTRGKRPQPFVNTALAQQNPTTEESNTNTARTPRMPFQDDDSTQSIYKEVTSPKNLSVPSPHVRQLSGGPFPGTQREPASQSRSSLAAPLGSHISLPMPRASEAVSPQPRQMMPVPAVVSAQSKPSRLNRLNPISLLTRRRSSQPSTQPENDTYRRNFMLGSTLPQDYVGIRGNRVHDFSAPRPRKVVSQQTMASRSSDRSPDGTGDLLHIRTKSQGESSSLSVPSPSPERRSESSTIPPSALKEKTEDDSRNTGQYNQDDLRNKNTPALARNSSSSSEYSDYDSETESESNDLPRDPLLLGDPTFGLFSTSEHASEPQEFSFIVPKHLAGPPPPPRTPRSRSQTPNQDRSPKGKSYHPPSAPRSPRSRSQTPSSQDRSAREHRAPRSASTPPLRESRTPSPQLTLLSRQSKSNASRFSFDLAGFGSSVQEKLLEDKHRQKISRNMRTSKISQMSVPETDDGFDSDDPELGEDWEEEVPGMNMDENDFPMAKSIADSTLDSTAGPKTSASALKPSLYTHQNVAMDLEQHKADTKEIPKPSKSFILRSSMFNTNQVQVNPGDDFYFDDGVIDDADLQTTGHFDESMFDDPSHRIGQQLHTTASLAIVPEQQSQESSIPSTRPMSLESALAAGHGPQASTDTSRTSIPPVQPWEKTATAKRSSMLKNDLTVPREVQANLTHGNLAAYHDALALAAQKAATDGRFDREASVVDDATPPGERPVLQLNGDVENTPGLQVDNLDPYDDFQDRVTFDDYEQEDDDVIAAANADALDYDEEFYGDEFHFYSTGDGAGESQYGGYFVNDIKRSHSGRANGQEPSLTPITEMSEWSTRNSMVSLPVDRNYGNAVHQPGLAQIADSLRDEDDNMSMSSLKRLRHNAFAGSASSLGSGGSGKNASPPSSSSQMLPRPGSRSQSDRSHPLRIQTSESGDNNSTSLQAASELSPGIRRPFVKGHSRNSSGAESVTYVHENDGEGSRWVLERRRITEDGSIEVLGRQVVEGGRI